MPKGGIALANIAKTYATESGEHTVFSGLTARFPEGSITSIIGPNGCGKSTLLNLIAGVVAPDSGTIQIDSARGSTPVVGYVWQDYRASLLPWLSVLENIAFPLRIKGIPRRTRLERASELLSRYGDGIDGASRCYNLSGGQQQKISILRSLVSEPDALLLDEPFSALDQEAKWSMVLTLERLWLQAPTPLVFVSHDVDEAILMADRVMLIGHRANTIEVLNNPLPRPRTLQILTSETHTQIRDHAIRFLTNSQLRHSPPAHGKDDQ